jgi:hypothetical protein
MPVIARFCGIVIRLLRLRSFGTRLHAFHGDSELVVDLASLRVIDGCVPAAVQQLILAWAKEHQRELMSGWWQKLPEARGPLSPALAS